MSLSINPFDTQPLSAIHAVSIACIDLVQGQRVVESLKVLFQSQSDITLWNRCALSKGVVTKKIERIPVSGIHGVAPLKQHVILEGISLPEFGPTKKVSGLVQATVIDDENPIAI